MELIQFDEQLVTSVFKHIQKEVISNGYMPDVDTFLDTQLEFERYEIAILGIQGLMGFDVKVFNHSSARRKADKKSPRIVIYQSRTLPGEIGAPNHAIILNDKTVGGKFKSGFMPTKASQVVLAIHLISATSRQYYILNSILANVIGQRQYLKLYDKETRTFLERRFLCEQTSFNDASDSLEGVFDAIYYYTIPDAYLQPASNVEEVAPIKYINVDTNLQQNLIEVGTKPQD